ncbi:hypothetical protein J421_1376 [Gemmatirosa kalamazoonensis]|uniref:Uncharacterized protein n=1 Tax=Gemmatirosa kalamazoonensis TaxID=861299 RepID=W0RHN3_9BACT|nr:hypothetical protein [Gemmatirosa kalamazoonensis]AHG88913.1 hypothetical protein J421_1376 [Gemmatirosa kalamazoonensis]
MRARITYTLAATLVVGALASTTAGAQSGAQTDTRWRAFVGCWQPVSPDNAITTTDDAKAMRVCVVPSGGPSEVDVMNVVNGKVAERTHVDATGAKHEIGREGCTGVESAEWSADGLRVYLKADLTCDGVKRSTSGILAFAPSGEWLDVQGVTTGKNSGVHVTRYRPVTDLAGLPAEVTSRISGAALAVSTARGAAAGPIGPEDVTDAVKHAQTPVVEAWLLERGQGFALDAKDLVSLADAGVPGSVTDLMVALTFPKTFAINRGSRDADLLRPSNASQGNVVSGRTIPVYIDPYGYSPFGWGAYGSYYSPYGYRYGYGSPYGYPYGGYGYGYSGPIIIVRNGDTPATPSTNPRVVRGQGYTENRSEPSVSRGSGYTNAGSSSSSGSSSGSSSTPSSSTGSSSSGGERTAHPRVP